MTTNNNEGKRGGISVAMGCDRQPAATNHEDARCLYRPIAIAILSLALCAGSPLAQNIPKSGSAHVAPNEWLLFADGRSWWYRTKPAPDSSPLKTRAPLRAEQAVVDLARGLIANNEDVRGLALLDGDAVVHMEFKAPADANSIFFGLSMGKTFTAMAAGQAICSGKLRMETRADELVSQLKDTALGQATVRDLLRMASGAAEPLSDSSIWTPEQFKRWGQGNLTILESVTEARVSKAARGVFSDYKPGEYFYYKSTDPMVVGLMVTRATGIPYSHWVQKTILDSMGAARDGFIVQDRQGDGAADAGVRLRLEDWIRFAQWVNRSSKAAGCFGDYVRAAMSPQIPNRAPTSRVSGEKEWEGYGYFMWAENPKVPDTVWALGAGGQSISWSKGSERMVVMFSNKYPGTRELERAWNGVGR